MDLIFIWALGGHIGMILWSNLESFWHDVALILDSLSDHFGVILDSTYVKASLPIFAQITAGCSLANDIKAESS